MKQSNRPVPVLFLCAVYATLVPGRVFAQEQTVSAHLEVSQLAYHPPASAKQESSRYIKIDKKEKAREMLPQLLRAVFNTKWNEQDILLTVDAGWRNDSLSIEYKYFKGNNLLLLDEKLLIEKIYFTVRPEEIDAIETETDEFLFLYLRNTKKIANIQQLATRSGSSEEEVGWRSSLGFPVRPDNLPLIIQYLKDLRTTE